MIPNPTEYTAPSERLRKIGIVSRRSVPSCYIVDRFMKPLHRTEGLAPFYDSSETLFRLAAAFKTARQTGQDVIEAFDDDTIFRIVPLGGAMHGCCQVFVDSFDRSASFMAAAKEHGLTRREAEILPLILGGMTNGEMAQKLFIAESTVADHMKSILRKTNAKKRSEVIARLYNFADGEHSGASTA